MSFFLLIFPPINLSSQGFSLIYHIWCFVFLMSCLCPFSFHLFISSIIHCRFFIPARPSINLSSQGFGPIYHICRFHILLFCVRWSVRLSATHLSLQYFNDLPLCSRPSISSSSQRFTFDWLCFFFNSSGINISLLSWSLLVSVCQSAQPPVTCPIDFLFRFLSVASSALSRPFAIFLSQVTNA